MAEFFSSQNPKRQFPIGLLVQPIITDIRPRSLVRKRVRVLYSLPRGGVIRVRAGTLDDTNGRCGSTYRRVSAQVLNAQLGT